MLYLLAKVSHIPEKFCVHSQNFELLRETLYACKPFMTEIIWSGKKDYISMFSRKTFTIPQESLLSLAQLLHSPRKFCICLQKFCIFLRNFAFTCKTFTFPRGTLHYNMWEEKLYFNVFAFSRKAFVFPPEI